MKYKLAGLLLGLGMILGVAFAADDYPIMVYPCPYAKQPPKIDGRLDDPSWQTAPWVSGFTFYNKNVPVTVQTSFRLLYDDRFLYVGVRCEEPLAKQLSLSPPSHRDDHGAVFGNEAIELFIDPFHDHSNYYQIAASIHGTIYDGKGTDVGWDSHTQVASTLGKDHWILDMKVPWADLGLTKIKPGTLIGLNLCRDRNLVAQYSCWSQVDANFHDVQRFGHVVLGGKPEDIGKYVVAYRKGDRKGPVRIFGAGGFSQISYLALARAALKELDSVLAELDSLRKKEQSQTVAQGIQKKLTEVRQQIAPVREKLKARNSIDATEWLHTESSLQTIAQDLRASLWNIRIESLLAEI